MADIANKHGGNIFAVKNKYAKRLTDFSANINPLGLTPRVKNALFSNFDRILHYPDPEAGELTKAIAGYWGVSAENIILGNGSVELIYLITQTFRPKTALIPSPTFSEYERAAKNTGAKARFIKLEDKHEFNLDMSSAGVGDIAFICNPNNPTANLCVSRSQDFNKHALFVIDEAFMDFLPDQKNHTLIWDAVKQKNMIVIRTFTKFFAIPGLRLGFAIADRENIKRLKKNQVPWSANSMAQLAALLALRDKKYAAETHKLIRIERDFLLRSLSAITGLKPYPSCVNFILIKLEKEGVTSKVLAQNCLAMGILIRNCDNFRGLGKRYFRVAVRSRGENLKLLGALRTIL